jgi:tyrosyl-tRNA synthetase
MWADLSEGAESLPILTLLGNSGKFPSRKEAKRLLQQGAVKVDGEKAGFDLQVNKPVGELIVQAGKRLFFKVLP